MEDLNQSISLLKGVGPKTFGYYKDAQIFTIKDLLFAFPKKYEIYEIDSIYNANPIDKITLDGVITSNAVSAKFRRGVDNLIFYFETEGLKIKVLMFGKGYMRFSLKKNMRVQIYGIYKKDKNEFVATEVFTNGLEVTVEPVYNIKNISNNAIPKLISKIYESGFEINDDIPSDMLSKYKLLNIKDYIYKSHFPQTKEDVRQVIRRKKYEEYFKYCLKIEGLRSAVLTNQKTPKTVDNSLIRDFVNKLPYLLTQSQMKAINDIARDMKNPFVMNRLIQGDVGSGKTIVAVIAALVNAQCGYQTVIMAPTEILAKQHYENFSKYLAEYNISVVLLTSSTTQANKTDIIRSLEHGSATVLISTHAILYNHINYKNLGLFIVDEQHRFGVMARKALLDEYPHTDAMYLTATPIPRTLGLTKFGDMDISSMTEKPMDRKNVVTKVFSYDDIDVIMSDLSLRVMSGEQAFMVVSQIEDNEMDLADIQSAKEMVLTHNPHIRVATLHGQMKSADKDQVMLDFLNKKYDLLISTTVIEVGIDVKNATGIYILDADRFGLSTLHQLRGRVGRNDKDAFCALITKKQLTERLHVLEASNDCFYLAEEDLKLRGPGELLGEIQSGFVGLDFNADLNIYNCAKQDAVECFSLVLNKIKSIPIVEEVIYSMKNKNAKLN